MRKIAIYVLVLAMLAGLAVPALASAEDTLTMGLVGTVTNLDPALAADAGSITLVAQLFSGLAKWVPGEDGSPTVAADCAETLPQGRVNEDGTVTYTYIIRSSVRWSDGLPITAGDFEYSWRRAAASGTGSPYRSLFSVISGYTADGDGSSLNIHALDDDTLEVTLSRDVPYWNELIASTPFFPVRQDVVSADPAWAASASTLMGNGPYKLLRWTYVSSILLDKNGRFHDADSVTLDRVEVSLFDSFESLLDAFSAGSVQLMDVPASQIGALAGQDKAVCRSVPLLGTDFLCWNANEELLPASYYDRNAQTAEDGTVIPVSAAQAEAARAEVRQAVNLLLDRAAICQDADQTPAATLVPPGMADADGSAFWEKDSYFDPSPDALAANREKAIATLKKYYTYDEDTGLFTDFPVLDCLYYSGPSNKAAAQELQSQLREAGIVVYTENQELSAFLRTRRAGDYSIAFCGAAVNYTDPLFLLELFTSGSGGNDLQLGKGAGAELAAYDLDLTRYGAEAPVEDGTWAQTYDVLISAIRGSADMTARFQLMHLAEDMLMDTGCIMPLAYQTGHYLLADGVKGVYTDPQGCFRFMNCTVG